MKLHKFYGRKSLIASMSAGTLLFSSQASAQVIIWNPINAVPLSTTSTIILGLLLLAFGMFAAPRIKNGHRVTFVITAVLVGMLTTDFGGKLITKAYAGVASMPFTIMTPSGEYHLERNYLNPITNEATNVDIMLHLDPEDCVFKPVENQCMDGQTLARGASCNAHPVCEDYPESETTTPPS